MKFHKDRASVFLATVLILFSFIFCAIAQTNTGGYSFTDLGEPLPGCNGIVPTSVNNKGEVVGYCIPNDGNSYYPQAFLWTNGVMKALAAPGFYTTARHIDDSGSIQGTGVNYYSDEYSGGRFDYYYNQLAVLQWNRDYPDDPSFWVSLDRPWFNPPYSGNFNNNGQVSWVTFLDQSWPEYPAWQLAPGHYTLAVPAIWNGGNVKIIRPADLQTWDIFSGWSNCMNDNGIVIGQIWRMNIIGATPYRQYLFISDNGGPPQELSTLPDGFYPWSLNNNLDILGYIGRNDHPYDPGICRLDGTFIPFGTWYGGGSIYPTSLNNPGQVVGAAVNVNNTTGQYDAFLWQVDPNTGQGVFTDLNAVVAVPEGWHLELPTCINDSGIIVGYSTVNGFSRAFMLTPAIIFVDANRDGEITFDGKDSTTKDKPFRFWLNDNVDATDGGIQQDIDPSSQNPDYSHTAIQNERDLEDFTRVHVKAPASFSADGTWQVSFQFTDLVKNGGFPGVNLWIAPTRDLGYLTDQSVAELLLNNSGMKICTVGSTEVLVDRSKFTIWANPDRLGAMLLEGSSTGKGALTVRFYHNKVKVSEGKVYLDLKPITRMYEHWTVGDTADTFKTFASFVPTVAPGDIQPAAGPTSDSGQYTNQSPEDPDYIIFVHGWRMLPWERRAFANTSYKRLWHLGYKGRFALFSWPTRYCAALANLIQWHNYDASEELAWASAPALQKLLVEKYKLSGGRVRIFAHSMGNQIVSEALLRNAFAPLTPLVQQRFFPLVHAYVATQAATVAQCYNQYLPDRNHDRRTPNYYRNYPVPDDTHEVAGTEYFAGIGPTVANLVNFYNPGDLALSDSIWGVNQGTKPDLDYRYFRDQFSYLGTPLNMPANKFTIFAHCDQAWCRALGRQPANTTTPTGAVVGPFSAELNLATILNLNIGTVHSYEFLNTFRETTPYWKQLESEFDVPVPVPSTPN